MKKTLFIVFVFLCTLAFASAQEEITWEKVLEANDPMHVIKTCGAMRVVNTESESAMALFWEDGDFRWAFDDSNLIDGVEYCYDVYEQKPYVALIAPDTDAMELVRPYLWEIDIRDFEPTDAFSMKDGQVYVKSEYTDEEYGIDITGEFYLNAETLFIERAVAAYSLGYYSGQSEEKALYGDEVKADFESFSIITEAEDAIDVSVHYPNGEIKTLRLARDSEIYVRVVENDWSVCISGAGEGRIDDFAWVEGDRAEVYVVSGYASPAKPTLSRVIENTSFESVMANNYDTMNITIWHSDPDENLIMAREIGWYLTEDNGLELFHETRNADFEVDYSSVARNGALYEWAEESGYSVTFFSDFSYAENALSGYKPVLDETTLTDNFFWNEDAYCWYISRTEELTGGGRREYIYNVDNEYDMISYFTFADYDKDGTLIQTAGGNVYGNSGNPCEKDVQKEFEKPSGAKKIKLTVVAPNSEKAVYVVRSDAAVSWEGKPLYKDAQCTSPVSDLEWVSGKKATVYVGKQ